MAKVGEIIGGVLIGATLVGMVLDGSRTERQKKELQQLDPERYELAEKRISGEMIPTSTLEDASFNTTNKRAFWDNEYKAVKDSLKREKVNKFIDSLQNTMTLDGISKKAEFVASQKLQDTVKVLKKL